MSSVDEMRRNLEQIHIGSVSAAEAMARLAQGLQSMVRVGRLMAGQKPIVVTMDDGVTREVWR